MPGTTHAAQRWTETLPGRHSTIPRRARGHGGRYAKEQESAVALEVQHSNSACTLGYSFGSSGESRMYVSHGCRGQFYCNGGLVSCEPYESACNECVCEQLAYDVKGCLGNFIPQAFDDIAGSPHESFAASFGLALYDLMVAISGNGNAIAKIHGLVMRVVPAAYRTGFGEVASNVTARLASDADVRVRIKVSEFALPATYEAGFGVAATRVAAQLADDIQSIVRERLAKFVLPTACEAGFGETASRLAAQLAEDTRMESKLVRKRVAEFAVPASYKAGFSSTASHILVRALSDPETNEAAARGMEKVAAQLPGLGTDGLQVAAAASGSASGLARDISQGLMRKLLSNLTEQGDAPVQTDGKMLCSHAGALLLVSPGTPCGIGAHHCPSAQACQATRCLTPEHADRPASPAVCSKGYQRDTAGRSTCESGMGRPARSSPARALRRRSLAPGGPTRCIPRLRARDGTAQQLFRQDQGRQRGEKNDGLRGDGVNDIASAPPLRGGRGRITEAAEMINPAVFSLEVASGGGSNSLDCLLAQGEGTADLSNLRAAMLAVPLALLALTAAASLVNAAWLRFASDTRQGTTPHPLWASTTTFLKNFVVWTAVFLPTLLMASLLSWPCVSTQMKESSEQWLAWDLQMKCGDQTGYLSVLTVWGLVAAGPLIWLGLIAMSHMLPPSMLSFLVGG
ncbi:unnamed protein product [Prorocentrum cordatum]|uniref:Uncharacterized protein n=1 Tax=Prorocentrum cordatum TaxID=2364126 RepID=A0ABN9WPZ9_9DINO|nr:unnamed protein product [Polarella glacialis]